AIYGDTLQYACHLSRAEINGDLVLQPDFGASGGLDIAGARIIGSIWAAGARFEAKGLAPADTGAPTADESRSAFRAQRSRCTSVIILSGASFAGHIDFLTADVGLLHLLDIRLAQEGSIGAANARFATNVEISLSPQT